jgi:hypothetical protein
MGTDLPPSTALVGAIVGRKRRSIVIRRNPPESWTRAGDLPRRRAVYAPAEGVVNLGAGVVANKTRRAGAWC